MMREHAIDQSALGTCVTPSAAGGRSQSAMHRRAFIQSALFTAAWGAHRTAAAGQSDRHGGRWIIPTNKPDRFGLKVMAFNPILKPDLAAWIASIDRPGPRAAAAHDRRSRPAGEGQAEQPPEVRAVLVGPDRLGGLPRPGADASWRALEGGGRLGPRRLRRQVLRLREAGGPAAPADAVRDRR